MSGSLDDSLRLIRVGAIPDGWFGKQSVTLLAPDGQCNVIISSEPLDPSVDTDRYASVQGDLLRQEFPGFRQASFDRVRSTTPIAVAGSRRRPPRRSITSPVTYR